MSSKTKRLQAENLSVYSRLYRSYWKRSFIYEARYKAHIFQDYIKQIGLPTEKLRILDYGFGFGHILFSFDQENEICGIEQSKEAVEGAERLARKRKYPVFDFVLADGTSQLPFKEKSFDLIVCSHVLEHIEHAEILMKEFARLLNSKGHLIVLIPINEKHRDPKHTIQFDMGTLSRIASQFDLNYFEPWEIDRINPYVMNFWHKGWHRRLKFLGSLISFLWNVVLNLMPWFIFRRLEKYLEGRGKEPHQLIVCLKKGWTELPPAHH